MERLGAQFGAAMTRLGPFERAPALAAAVSGGADSLALALLARDWTARRRGNLLALVVDHGLRSESASEAALTVTRLASRGIAARVLGLNGLARGPGLAARARVARYAALDEACAEAGILHLLIGHHAGDQAETLRMRVGAGSGARGMAGMAALAEGAVARRLRPLLAVPPGRLRELLREEGLDWIEDPSNRDMTTLRARLRAELDDRDGDGPMVSALLAEATRYGLERTTQDAAVAATLAARVQVHPTGIAILSAGPIASVALSALLCMVAGRRYPVGRGAVTRLAVNLRAATLAGARLLPAGRAGAPGDWLVVREAAAMRPPMAAAHGALWDGRFSLTDPTGAAEGLTLGALGVAAAQLRRTLPGWPAAVLQTLPALRRDGVLVAVPSLAWPGTAPSAKLAIQFRPALPLAGAAFLGM